MEFKWITLQVKDMQASLCFYQKIVGLPISAHIEAPGMEIYFLGEGQTKVELIYNEANKEVTMAKGISLGFAVEDLDRMISFVEKEGLKIHSGPFFPNPSTGFFYVLDPDGLAVQFVEQR